VNRATLAACLLIVHAPDGTSLWVQAESVSVIKPVTKHRDHVAKDTVSVLTVSGKSFGVTEAPERIADMVEGCK
jgi:hypothetical protein